MVLSSAAAVIGQTQPAPPAPPPAAALAITWSVTVESPLVAPPSALGRRVFVPLRLGVVLAIDRETGRELWRASVLAQHAAAADQGRVVVATIDALIALDATTGATSWRIALKGAAVPPMARGGWVLVGTASGDLLALRGADGTLVWRVALGAPLQSVPAIDGDRAYLALADGALVALDLTTGQVIWQQKLPAPGGAITPAGDRLFVGCRDNFFYSIDARNGKRRWRWRTGADVPFGAAYDEARVYFVSLDNLLRALDVDSGTLQWRQPLDTRPIAAPRLNGGELTLAGLGAELLLFKAKDGTPIGKWTAPAELSVAPLLFGASDATLVRAVVVTGDASGDWRLYAVSAVIEPSPAPLKEIPGRPLSPDIPPAPPGSPPQAG